MSALTRLASGQSLSAAEREELLELLLSLQKRAANAEAKLESVRIRLEEFGNSPEFEDILDSQ